MTSPADGGLRRKLVGLLTAFGIFAVVSAAATIYGTQSYIASAGKDFETVIGFTAQAQRLGLILRQQALLLHGLIADQENTVRPYYAARDEFQTLLRQLDKFSVAEEERSYWLRLMQLNDRMIAESDRCLAAIDGERRDEAAAILSNVIEGQLLPEMESRLSEVRAQLDRQLSASSRILASSSRMVLFMTLAVAALATGLVVVGAIFIRRWLIQPVQSLQRAADRFATGDLTSHIAVSSNDELGQLARAMNEMAGSLTRTQGELVASEAKNRLLFQNLRDAVVLVDDCGAVVEFHDNDTHLLGVEGLEHLGRPLLDVWPLWREAGCDWTAVLDATIREGRRYRANAIELPGSASGRPSSIVDLLVFRVEWGTTRLAAVVLRDVSDRTDLERRLRQAETMEAVGTLAGGLAHDFNNLLAGVIGNLSVLEGQLPIEEQAERVRAAVRTCWQASALSRRLLNFAGSAHGQPQSFLIHDAMRTILEALDPSFLEGIELVCDLREEAIVRMDRDQFTQSVLNLVRNAREAMPDGGRLTVSLERATARHPEGGRSEQAFAVLVIRDTGVGMSADVQARIFEPFFTTKSRASHRGRGMGMAIVYAAVRNAGGFIRLESAPQNGTIFRLYLPVAESLSLTQHSLEPEIPSIPDSAQ